jgi:hypothetical protein
VDAKRVGRAGLHGWKRRVSERVAEPVSRRTPWSREAIEAAFGVVWFALSLRYVLRTLAALRRRAD